jgi:C4-dicarboxylate-binding protein DctP
MKRFLILALVVFFLTGFFPGICPKAIIKEAQAATYLFKFAHAQPPTHPRHNSMIFFKEKLESASQGRIKVELYAGGVLGKEPELMDMVKVGTIQGTRGALFERANKKFLLYTLPFFFSDIEQAKRLIRSSFGEKLNQGATANGFYVPATGVLYRNLHGFKNEGGRWRRESVLKHRGDEILRSAKVSYRSELPNPSGSILCESGMV